jgi:hypothetical protein
MNDDKTLEMLMGIIDDAFNSHYNKEEKMETQTEPSPQQEQSASNPKYTCIAEYTEQTGKRFRMTKDQKQRELTREEAFNETFGGTN